MEDCDVHGLSLEWKRCPDGVELVDLPDSEPGLLDANSPGGMSFRARTSRRYPIKLEVADLEDPIVMPFINALDDNARAQFLGRFGFLDDVDQSSCQVSDVKGSQASMRKLLASAGSAEPNIAAINKELRRWGRSDLRPALDGRRLSFQLGSLLGLMLREVVLVVEKDARFTTCQHCGKAFLTGPTTGRRSHAAYCSDRCRVAAMRARNSER